MLLTILVKAAFFHLAATSYKSMAKMPSCSRAMAPALAFLETCHQFGAGGIQFPFGPDDASSLDEIRSRAERYGMRVEGILNLPATDHDLLRFEQALGWAIRAGAKLARTAVIPGRRYEQFKTLSEFRGAETRALASVQRAEPVLARHRFRLAIENHKDQLVGEKLELLRQIGSEFVGLCVDVGNNIALAEEPLGVVRALAPCAFTVHLKDHFVTPDPDGFLLWDAPLGEGVLDLAEMVRVLRPVSPQASFNLEVITRDPLKNPIHTDAYWATLPGRREGNLEWISAMLEKSPPPTYAPPIAALDHKQQMALEMGTAKLRQKLRSPFPHQVGEMRFLVRKIIKRT